MGYIELKGLDGIPGLSSKDRDDFFKERESRILEMYPEITDTQIDELYLNKKIFDSFGEEELNRLSSLDEKISYWQSNYNTLDKASQTYLGFNRYQTPYDRDAPKPDESNWFNRNVLNGLGKENFYDLRDWFDASSGVIKEPEDMDNDAVVLDSFKAYTGDFKNNPNYHKDIELYSKELKDMFYSDRITAANQFRTFVDMANEKSYYFRNYYGSYMLPLSIESAEELMSKYYAIRELGNEEEADIYLNRTIQNIVESKQTIPDKIANTVGAGAANLVGNLAVWAGLLLNSPTGVWGSLAKKWEIEGINGYEEFLYYSANNDLVKWGNNVMTTGFYHPKSQAIAKETGYNKNLLIKEYDESNGTFTQDFFNLETFLEAVAQVGFTHAGVTEAIAGRFIAKQLAKPIGKLATKAAASEAKALATVLTKVEQSIMWAVPAFSAAYAEGSMEAYGMAESFMNNVDNLTRKNLYDNYFNDYFKNNFKQHTLRIPTEESPITEDEIAYINALNVKEQARVREQFEKEVVERTLNSEEYKNYVNRMNAQIISSDTWKNTLWIGTGDALLSRMLGPAVTEARHRLFGVRGSGQFTEVIEDGVARVAATRQTGTTTAKAVKDVVWEGVEEGGQQVMGNVEVALANNNVLNYVNAVMDGSSVEELNDSFFRNLDVVGSSIGQSFRDKETWKSFMLGALSTGMGRIAPGQGIRTIRNLDYTKYNMLGSSKWDMVRDVVGAFYYNPIIDAVREANSDYAQAKADAEFFNSWISEEENAELVKSVGGVAAFVEKTRQALHEGNEKEYRDTQLASTLRILRMYDKFEGTSYYNSLVSYMETLSNIDTASEETKANVLERARPLYSGIQTTDEEILGNVKKHAQEMKSMWSKSRELYSSIESEFGRAIDSETKEAIVYGLIGVEDWKNRLAQINKNIDKISDKKLNTSSEIANALARIGTVENGRTLLEKAKERLSYTQALSPKRSRLSREYKRQEVAKIKNEIKQLKKDLSTLEGVDTKSIRLSRADILGLGNVERHKILTDKSIKKLLSQDSQESIDSILNDITLSSETLKEIEDAATIQEDIDYHNEFLANLRRSKDAAAMLGYEIRANQVTKNLRRRVADFIDETNYDTFKEKLTKFLELNVLSDFERAQLGTVFISNPNYLKYSISKAIKTAQHRTASTTSAYKNMPQKYARVIKAIIKNIYEEEGFKSTDYARNLLTDGGFLAKEGLSLNDFTQEDIDAIVDIIGEVIKQTANLEAEAKAARDAKIDNSAKPTPQPEVIPPVEVPPVVEDPAPVVENNDFIELGSVNIISEEDITDEKLKEFYARNEVSKVLEALKEKYDSNMGLSQDEFVVYVDETFISEMDSYNSDTYPIAAAVVVDEDFKGPYKEVDGKRVAIVGMIEVSRKSESDKLNTLNRVRRLALNNGNTESYLLSDHNGLITFKGALFKSEQRQSTAANMPSNRLMESLINIHEGDVDAALQDFLDHTFYASVAKNDTEGKERYVYKKRTLYYTDKSGKQKSVVAEPFYGTTLLYINGDTVLVLGTRNDYTLSDGSSIFDQLTNENAELLFDRDYNSEVGFIKELLNSLAIGLSKEEVISKLTDASVIDYSDIERDINKRIGRHLNLLRYSGNEEGLFKVRIKKGKFADKDSIILSISSSDGETTWELTNIPIESLKKEAKRKGALSVLRPSLYSDYSTVLKNSLIEAVRKIIFNEDGTVRKYKAQNGNDVAMFKPEVYDALISDEEYATKLFYSNLLYIVETSSSSPSQLALNNAVPKNEDGSKKTPKQSTEKALGDLFTQTKETQFDKSEYTSVSEFISEDIAEEEVSSEVNEHLQEPVVEGGTNDGPKTINSDSKEVRMAIGTSLDSFLKLWFSPEVSQDVEKLSKYLKDNKIYNWDFLTKGQQETIGGTLGKFIREAQKLSKFLKDRGETIISFGAIEELELFAELKTEDGKSMKIRGIPDLITVDAHGEVHIYDYKTFTQKRDATGEYTKPRFDGFNNGTKGFVVVGNTETYGGFWDKYQRQLSMYKALLEAAIPGIKVASLGIIPIGVEYKTDVELVYSTERNPHTKAHRITTVDGRPFHITKTEMFNDAIRVSPIPIDQISPSKWEGKKNGPVTTTLGTARVESHSPVVLGQQGSVFERNVSNKGEQDKTYEMIMSGITESIKECIIHK